VKFVEQWRELTEDSVRQRATMDPITQRNVSAIVLGVGILLALVALAFVDDIFAGDRFKSSQIARRAYGAGSRYQTAAARDEVVSAVRAHAWRADESLWITADSTLPAEAIEWVRRVVDAEVSKEGPAAGGGRVVVVVLNARRAQPSGIANSGQRVSVLPPSPITNGACVVIVPTYSMFLTREYWPMNGRSAASYGDTSRMIRGTLIGSGLHACAFVRAFGPPAPGVAAWLDSAAWRPVMRAAWQLPMHSWWEGFRDDSTNRTALDSLTIPLFEGGWNRLAVRSALHCMAGEVDECTTALRREPMIPDRVLTVTGAVSTSAWGYVSVNPIPDDETMGQWGSFAIARCGRERFGKFWRGNGSAADAYLAACGESLDRSAQALLMRFHGARDISPRPRPILALSVLLSVGLLGALATRSRRPPV
jgi:hypothetical protein